LKGARAVLRGGGDSNAVSLPDRHYQGETIILCVRWYLRYAFSYCDLEEMMRERDLSVDHTGSAYLASAYALKMHSVYRPAMENLGTDLVLKLFVRASFCGSPKVVRSAFSTTSSSCLTLVPVMQSADFGDFDHLATTARL
jgi:hypothetical protein